MQYLSGPGELDAPEALELPGKSPGPARAARLTRAQVSAALKRAGRRDITERATAILAALRSEQLARPPALAAAYGAAVRALIAVITALNEQVKILEQQVRDHFGRHPDAEVILSQPGTGPVPGARVLAEFGGDPRRYAGGRARRNYAATSPVTRAPGKKKVVAARFVHNGRLVGALNAHAFSARLTRRPRLLRPAARQRPRAQRRPATPRQPARRHPPRLPENPHPLRRGHRLGSPPANPASRLTT
jgi:hypothetical protein